MAGLRSLVQRFDEASASGSALVAAWVLDPSGDSRAMAQARAVFGSCTPGMAAKTSADSRRDVSKSTGTVRLVDAAKCMVYVCFEGPLGAHLKSEMWDKIWRVDYAEIFTLLPLEKFKLDRFKPEVSKKEDKEKRCYRLIPRTFSNRLQAFAIFASVIREKIS